MEIDFKQHISYKDLAPKLRVSPTNSSLKDRNCVLRCQFAHGAHELRNKKYHGCFSLLFGKALDPVVSAGILHFWMYLVNFLSCFSNISIGRNKNQKRGKEEASWSLWRVFQRPNSGMFSPGPELTNPSDSWISLPKRAPWTGFEAKWMDLDSKGYQTKDSDVTRGIKRVSAWIGR